MRFRRFVALLFGAIALQVPLHAELPTKRVLTLDVAKTIAAAAKAEALKRGAKVVIVVTDEGGHMLYLERLNDTQVASVDVGIGKARTAAIFRRPSKVFEDQIARAMSQRSRCQERHRFKAACRSSSMARSLAPSASAGTRRRKTKTSPGPAQPRSRTRSPEFPRRSAYWKSTDVAAAFAKGSVLFGDEGGRNYMVHASHRESAGMAEVHELDADIIYVLDGSATFVTGGTVENRKTTAPNEIRGSSITGGEVRRITKGDVIIVPNGTPHWFKDVSGPLNYYVVKVR